ncbi:MAG: hypothetical protein NTY38_00560 [Acidobacteria bacterium]|nr:hypothetical protein [Acidobacteriota bacterium]
MTLLWLGVIAFLLVAAAFAYLIRQILARPNIPEFESTWIERFSMRKYKPMERLLSEQDFMFLAAVAGDRPEIGNKLRRDRRRVLRSYLRTIRRDRLQVVFQFALCHAWLQVALNQFGVGTVDLSRVVRPVAMLHAQIGTVPAAA